MEQKKTCLPLRLPCFIYGPLTILGQNENEQIRQMNPLKVLLNPEALCKIEAGLIEIANVDTTKYTYNTERGFINDIEAIGARILKARNMAIALQSNPDNPNYIKAMSFMGIF